MAMVVVASLPLAFVRTKAFERGVHLRGLVRVMVLGASPPRVHWVPARLFACACIACICSEGARKHMWAPQCCTLRSLSPTLSPTCERIERSKRSRHPHFYACVSGPSDPAGATFSKLKIVHRFLFNRCQSSSGSMSSKSSLFSQALGRGMTLSCISGSSSSLSRRESGGGS